MRLDPAQSRSRAESVKTRPAFGGSYVSFDAGNIYGTYQAQGKVSEVREKTDKLR
jgi:hypothetical protein